MVIDAEGQPMPAYQDQIGDMVAKIAQDAPPEGIKLYGNPD